MTSVPLISERPIIVSETCFVDRFPPSPYRSKRLIKKLRKRLGVEPDMRFRSDGAVIIHPVIWERDFTVDCVLAETGERVRRRVREYRDDENHGDPNDYIRLRHSGHSRGLAVPATADDEIATPIETVESLTPRYWLIERVAQRPCEHHRIDMMRQYPICLDCDMLFDEKMNELGKAMQY